MAESKKALQVQVVDLETLNLDKPHFSCSDQLASQTRSTIESDTANLKETSKEDYLPEMPEEPLQSDCCGSGCSHCVFDIYQEELEQWQKLSAMTVEERLQWSKKQQQAGESDKHSTVLKALSPTECRTFTVEEIVKLTSDSCIFTFSLPPGQTLGLHVGQHVVLRVFSSDGEAISRQYTPISPLDQQGSFSVLIKIYDDGRMSQFVKEWQVGSTALWKGPFGGFQYSQNKYDRIGLLACGTGIAPMVQLIRTVVENEKENTFVHLVYSCRTQNDILMKKELEYFASFWNFTVLYVITRTFEASLRTDNPGLVKYGDKISLGRIDQELVLKEMPSPSQRNIVLICGTKSFDKDMINYLNKAGYTKDTYFKF